MLDNWLKYWQLSISLELTMHIATCWNQFPIRQQYIYVDKDKPIMDPFVISRSVIFKRFLSSTFDFLVRGCRRLSTFTGAVTNEQNGETLVFYYNKLTTQWHQLTVNLSTAVKSSSRNTLALSYFCIVSLASRDLKIQNNTQQINQRLLTDMSVKIFYQLEVLAYTGREINNQ